MSALLVLVSVRGALAGTIRVDASGGGDFTSIQSAVDEARDGDVIQVTAGLYEESLRLGARDLSIVGAGASQVSVGAAKTPAVITFLGGASVTVSDLTLAAADTAVDQVGGALALRGVAVVGFSSTALWVESGDLTLEDAVLSDNHGRQGGALRATDSRVDLTDVTFERNRAETTGGALDALDSTVEAVRVSWIDNEAGTEGGAIASEGSVLRASASPFSGNQASLGGAAVVRGGTVSLDGSRLEANATTSGATLHTEDAALSLDEVDFEANAGSAVTSLGGTVALRDLQVRGHDVGVRLEGVRQSTAIRLHLASNSEGLIVRDAADLRIANLVAIANSGAGATFGGDNTDLVLENADLVDNERGLFVSDGSGGTVVNVNAVANTAGGFAAESGTVSVSHANAWGNGSDWGALGDLAGADGNLSADPVYAALSADGADNDALGLLSGSPCIDAGSTAIIDLDGTRSDIGSFGGPDAEVSDDDGDGYAESTGDCDDDDASVHPGADETWYDGVDSDCDGANDHDADGDGWAGGSEDAEDCDDQDPEVHPGADDVNGDGSDTNCDGVDGYATGSAQDRDGDGFTEDDGDCNDWDRQIHPDAPEACGSNIDNDCDGVLDRQEDACAIDGGCGCEAAGSARVAWLALLALGLRRRS